MYNIETWKHCPLIKKITLFMDDFKKGIRLIILFLFVFVNNRK